MTDTTTDEPTYHAAKAPTRATFSGSLSLGLLNIPVQIFSGEERDTAATIKRSMRTPDGHEVGRASFDKMTGELATEVRLIATASDGTPVELTDDEKGQVLGDTSRTLLIENLIPLEALGTTYHVDKTDQIRPGKIQVGSKKVPDPGAQKAFVLLTGALGNLDAAALVRIGQRWGAVCPDGRFVRLLFSEQVRQELPFPDVEVSDAEVRAASALLEATGFDEPVLVDEASSALQAFVDAKAAGQEAPPVVAEAEPAPVVDLLAALEASVESVRSRRIAEPPRKARPAKPRKRTPAAAETQEVA